MVYLCKTYVDYNEVNVLLNENKVKMMTKMAIYEKNEGRRMLRIPLTSRMMSRQG